MVVFFLVAIMYKGSHFHEILEPVGLLPDMEWSGVVESDLREQDALRERWRSHVRGQEPFWAAKPEEDKLKYYIHNVNARAIHNLDPHDSKNTLRLKIRFSYLFSSLSLYVKIVI